MIHPSSTRRRIDDGTADGEQVVVNGRLGARATTVLAAALDRLIPGDEFGPGALETGAGRSIGGMLSRADPSLCAEWRHSLAQLDALALTRAGAGFAELDGATQDDLLELVAAGGAPASESAAIFFEMLRLRAIEGYFGDPRWGGNAGRAGWAMLGYEGPRVVWSAYDERLESTLAS